LRKYNAAESADHLLRAPSIPSEPAGSAVPAAASARVLVITARIGSVRMSIGSATPSVSWCSPSHASTWITFNAGINNRSRCIPHEPGRAGDTFAFGAMKAS
jgi:hypothetical protein